MSDKQARSLMYIGAGLMISGVALPFLMVIKILTSTLFLNFFSYTIQILGLVLGMIGLVNLAVHRKK